jgi:DNA mismatch endonuclease (patch repair protein)
VHYPVPGKPRRKIDIAFPKRRIAIFLDGCFWHGCPQHGIIPKRNREWWTAKLHKNAERDTDTTIHLQNAGWTVMRFWEHVDADEVVQSVSQAFLD